MAQLSGNVLIGQSGGPTAVINASLAGVVTAARRHRRMGRVLGMRFGIEGFLQGQIVDLGAQSAATITGLARTPSSALGSCRYKLKDADLPRVLAALERHDVRYLFLIGGNDTMDTIQRIEAHAAAAGYPLIGIGIPKTVDNDLYGTDHTPGYGSAARYVALSVRQAGLLARDMRRVDRFVVHQTVGREAGWLPAASALARTTPDSAPHLILLPEVPFDEGVFLDAVKRIHRRHGYVFVVCGEGITRADGSPVSAARARDRFANVEFGAMGGSSVAFQLHQLIAGELGWRGEFQITESLPMCAADRASAVDRREAAACGRRAVALAAAGVTGVMVSLVRRRGRRYGVELGTAPLVDVAVHAKPMPRSMIARSGMHVTRRFLDYAAPLVGELPRFTDLDMRLR